MGLAFPVLDDVVRPDVLVPCFADVEPQEVNWLWPGRIPLGKITILDGDPGTGKSSIALDLAARLSRGARTMPDGGPGLHSATLFCSLEDDIADTLRPRLEAMGGDPSQVYGLPVLPNDRAPQLPDNVDVIRDIVDVFGARLVVLDPLVAFLSPAHNAHRDQDVRAALAPLATMAAETGVAVLCVRHLNKSNGGPAIYRGGGSIGIAGAARSVLLAARDPDDETGERRVLAVSKCNLAAPAPSLSYRLEAADGSLRVVWGGASQHTADNLVRQPEDAAERSALDEAKAFLETALADGPRPSRELAAEARREGIQPRTVERARHVIGARSFRSGFLGAGGQWMVEMSVDRHSPGLAGYGKSDGVNGCDSETSRRPPTVDRQVGLAGYEYGRDEREGLQMDGLR